MKQPHLRKRAENVEEKRTRPSAEEPGGYSPEYGVADFQSQRKESDTLIALGLNGAGRREAFEDEATKGRSLQQKQM
ncbi:hypothetical protein [Bacteroides pyogenes]|uniref:hypothetical protein n=1 Tax=Bacteroides pyogenes TaxID=310300 RepID=UPI001BA6A4AC|nr:hypothetical protein [Bacteroides pyogenes]MCE9105787.1 hypothetical protein [Bacteroides pyogenes]MDY5434830.1 hypothetical protein [Bacteroides pyogenes]